MNTITKRIQVPVDTLRISIPRADLFDEDDNPLKLPLITGDAWTFDVDLATGTILKWPGPAVDVFAKVCDAGTYTLFGAGKEIAKVEGYVPDCVPGECGDYINLRISANGTIADWPIDEPCLSEFEEEDD